MKALIPLDGSETARSVLPTVQRFLKVIPSAEIHLLTVLDPRSIHGAVAPAPEQQPPISPGGMGPAIAAPPPRIVESHGEAMARVDTETREALEAIARDEFPGVPAVCSTAWSRQVPEAIRATAGAIGADLIVMATHGHSGISHVLMGSVAEEVVRTSGRPVLVVRAL
ncbi:MAG: universal stress protein, partial [Dehalococcoidia bacterium]|nr:universal stress protein [Dehalococcoidia bacterium]